MLVNNANFGKLGEKQEKEKKAKKLQAKKNKMKVAFFLKWKILAQFIDVVVSVSVKLAFGICNLYGLADWLITWWSRRKFDGILQDLWEDI